MPVYPGVTTGVFRQDDDTTHTATIPAAATIDPATAAPARPGPTRAIRRQAVVTPGGGKGSLRNVLVLSDVLATSAAWTLAHVWGTSAGALQIVAAVAILAALSVGVANSQRLYRARVCAIRSIELARLGRVALVSGAAALLIEQVCHVHILTRWLIFGTAAQYLLSGLLRGRFTSWLKDRRSAGDYQREVILVGDNDEARELWQLTLNHPETGYRVIGCIGDPVKAVETGLGVPWLGGYADLPHALGDNQWVIVAGSSLSPAAVNQVVRQLWTAGVHVQVSSGLAGISYRRIRPLPLAHEPLFYLERATPTRSQLAAKRALDVLLAGVGVLLTSPVLAAAALAIKLTDGGPVLYRQTRVGRYGATFDVLKLRTMVPEAPSLLEQLQHLNERSGPLFKIEDDPRVTRVGRLLRASSIDELPQLLNVLRGQMSMVGPRPALPEEVARFDEDLQARQLVTPGLTGLWQVEGRDNPSFDVYRRLDLFYLENWSIFLDLMIIASTAGVVITRARRALRPSSSRPAATDLATVGDIADIALD